MVIAIIAVLIALLLPAVQQAREAARRSQCKNNLKQIGLALHNYADTHGCLPIGALFADLGDVVPNGSNRSTWMAYILPFMDQGPLYAKMDFENRKMTANWDPQKVREVVIPAYRCPTDSMLSVTNGYAPTNYVACIGTAWTLYGDGGRQASGAGYGSYIIGNGTWARMVLNDGMQKGVFATNSHTKFQSIKDGTSNTLAVSECKVGTEWQSLTVSTFVPCDTSGATLNKNRGYSWMYGHEMSWLFNTLQVPNSLGDDCARFEVYANAPARSHHTGGVHALLADGSVRFVSDNIHKGTWENLGNQADGQVVGEY